MQMQSIWYFMWMKSIFRGKQSRIPTPGKNQKNYLASALNTKTGRVEWEKKNTFIFLRLMAELRKRYRQAKTIRLIAENYIIHKSEIIKKFQTYSSVSISPLG